MDHGVWVKAAQRLDAIVAPDVAATLPDQQGDLSAIDVRGE
jgi:hypothetical protein